MWSNQFEGTSHRELLMRKPVSVSVENIDEFTRKAHNRDTAKYKTKQQ